jgi:hypothetical protein
MFFFQRTLFSTIFYPKHLEKYLDKLIQSFFFKKNIQQPEIQPETKNISELKYVFLMHFDD